MGQRASTTTARKGSFTDVVPSSQASRRSSTVSAGRLESLAIARPVEGAVPSIHAPPHALLQSPKQANATITSPRQQAAVAVPESVRKSRTLAQFEQTCSEILPAFLFVSNLEVAKDRTLLRRVGITHVLNCCKEVVCFQPRDVDEITYMQLALRDGVQEDLLPFLPLAMEWIDACQCQGGRVLVHCHQGVSRSCAFAIAYVMYRDRCGFQSAMASVKAKRTICSPNAAFLCQLLEWERELADAETPEYGLCRLAPHAIYDVSTLVLKPCYYSDSRRKVPLSANRMDWLWGHGIFVFVDTLQQEIVVWKGEQCTIANGIDQAKDHAQRMLRVLGGDVAASEMAIRVVEGSAEELGHDHFGYASELAWREPTPVPDTDTTLGEEGSKVVEELAQEKPMLFLLEGESVWEQLTNYDSDDLVASSVLLLVATQEAYLWIGQAYNESTVEILQATSQKQLERCGNATGKLRVEQQHAESQGFWEAFEAGY